MRPSLKFDGWPERSIRSTMPFGVIVCVGTYVSTPLLLPATLRQTRLLSCDSLPQTLTPFRIWGFTSGSLSCDSTIAYCSPMSRCRLSGSCLVATVCESPARIGEEVRKDNKAVSRLRLHGEPCLAKETAARTCQERLQNDCLLQLCSILLMLPLVHDLPTLTTFYLPDKFDD